MEEGARAGGKRERRGVLLYTEGAITGKSWRAVRSVERKEEVGEQPRGNSGRMGLK